MYEGEVNHKKEPIDVIPPDVRERFLELVKVVRARTVLPWSEHCTECVWPTCYSTCELYTPRKDGACRLFIDGMVRIDFKETLNPYLLKIIFKPWGKLWSIGNTNLYGPMKAKKLEQLNISAGAVVQALPLPKSLAKLVIGKICYLKNQWARKIKPQNDLPDYFLLECYNPNDDAVGLNFTIRDPHGAYARYQKLLHIPHGFHREKIDFFELRYAVSSCRSFEIEITPNHASDVLLYFGLIDFVKEQVPEKKEKKIKCIVWDLDNTLWHGTLIEDAPDALKLKDGVIDIIKETDRRGILHSIASKNDHNDALKVLTRHGIEDYFLYPQISWAPKSQAVERISKLLNIGADTLLFIDDQQFEREEVKAAHPGVTVIDAGRYLSLPELDECRVPVTDDSAKRRLTYRQQQKRNDALATFGGNYMDFLRDCGMKVRICSLSERNMERVFELAQRTNQLNFSGSRYSREQLKEIMDSYVTRTYVMKCRDRFGDYGIVGFAVMDLRELRLLDLMFSCRVQGKRVEHAFLSWLVRQHATDPRADVYANYRRTPKNTPSGKVFAEMGFEPVAVKEGLESLVFRTDKTVPDDKIVEIVEEKEV